MHGHIVVHTAENVGSGTRYQVDSRMDSHQNDGKHCIQSCLSIVLVRIRAHEEVG